HSSYLPLLCCSRATATTHLYTLSLHDALPISLERTSQIALLLGQITLRSLDGTRLLFAILTATCPEFASTRIPIAAFRKLFATRSEEHTSELQSRENLVCRLLLEKKKHRRK